MARRTKSDPFVAVIEQTLCLGRFISYQQSTDFVSDLECVKAKLDTLADQGDAVQAVSLYELFLAGCYEKAEEIDDSGGELGGFFAELFVAWIGARQKAERPADETVRQIRRCG